MIELNSYFSYKLSGVEWLGDVPTHWAIERTKWLFQKMERPVREGDEVVTCFRDGIVTLRKNRRELGFTESLKEIGYQGIRCGDLVIHSMDAFAGAIGIADSDGKGTPVYSVCKPSSQVNAYFYAYILREMARKGWIQALAKGIRERSSDFRYTDFASQLVPLPPFSEQTAIVRFLDHADRRIRRYIRAKQKLIALLEEQKQAIIHQAVTGQIDVRTGEPYPSYKDSGVEWLGDVPKHWGKTRLKVVLSHSTQNGLFKKKDQFGAGVPLINVADVYGERFYVDPSTLDRVQASPEEIRRFQVQDGDIFFVRSSLKLEGTGRSAIATNCSPDTVFECHLVQARPDDCQVNPRYLVVQLNSYAFRHLLISQANMVTMATIAQDTISSCPVVMPPHSEQDRIVRWIDTQWDRITNAIESGNREIDFIREYRTRLIADVVTGKLDVREAAAELPEVDPLAEDDLDSTIHDRENSNLGELDAEKSAAEYTIKRR